MDTSPHQLSRRGVLASATGLLALPATGWAKSDGVSPNNALWYERPAEVWEQALPVGNGRLGAMVFGRVGQERLQLNEDTLWSGGPYTADSPDAFAALPEVRQLIAEGKFKEATDLASSKIMARPLSQMAYGTLGDLFLNFTDAQAPSHYERRLDLETAIATTRYETAVSKIVRETFASAIDQVVVVRISASGKTLALSTGYRGPRAVKLSASAFAGDAKDAFSSGPTDWLMGEALGERRPDTVIRADGDGALVITGQNESSNGVAGALTYAVRIKAVSDGDVTATGEGLQINNAGTVTLYIAAATSFVRFDDVSGDPVSKVRSQTEAAAAKAYDSVKLAHIRDYQSLFRPVALNLGASKAVHLPTDARLAASEHADDPSLHALYFQYARYLLISSSRPGTQAANLQGIWNQATNPPWGSKYTININTEMNYWPADPAGLSACVEPLIRLVEELSVTGAKTAATMYRARGWVAHHNTDIWRASAPIDGPMWGLWPCGGAWLCNSLWDHCDYTRETGLPPRLYPLMKGAALFFLDTLVEDPKGRGLVTSPSVSPENQHPYGSSLCAGPAMDRQIVRDLFANTLACGKLVGGDADFLAQIASARDRLAPDKIGKAGQLQEWLDDWDGDAPEPHHRHVSHLYAVYPSHQINVRDTPELLKAARRSLLQRGDMATGWGTAWRVCLWARMGEGNHAYAVLKDLIGPGRTYPNMFDAHPPFQIDGNFGGAAGMVEMLMQSWGDEIRLLPSLPTAWPDGQVLGLKARGNVTVDLTWKAGRLATCTLKGQPGAKIRIRHADEVGDYRFNAQGLLRYQGQHL